MGESYVVLGLVKSEEKKEEGFKSRKKKMISIKQGADGWGRGEGVRLHDLLEDLVPGTTG